jgi:hypothetical protein
MDTSQIAIIISIFSVLVAAFSLGWNIYRDVILKPKVVVTFAIKNIVAVGRAPSPDNIGISAVNHGPGPLILNTIILKQSSFWRRLFRKEKFAVLMHDLKNPYSSKLPRRLEVGESLDLFVPFNENCFLKEPFTHLGLSDSFGRSNWARTGTMKHNRKIWAEKFDSKT